MRELRRRDSEDLRGSSSHENVTQQSDSVTQTQTFVQSWASLAQEFDVRRDVPEIGNLW